MAKMNEVFWENSAPNTRSTFHVDCTSSNSIVRITDKRVAQLLLVLHELDESVTKMEDLPKSDLSELVSNAILACGFVDPMEARHAIAAVLEVIGEPDTPLEYS